MDIILPTRNTDKLAQVKGLFEGSPVKILSLDEARIGGKPGDVGNSLEDKAFRKARYAWVRAHNDTWTMADETGLFIDALGGAPGIRSSSWAGKNASTHEITEHTLKKLKGISNRKATFRTVVVVIGPSEDQWTFEAEVRGTILEAERVPAQRMMPYSGIFLPDGSDKVWAEMSLDEENALSQRGKVFREVKEFLLGRVALGD